MSDSLVSCIITCYNQQEFLREAIESVLNQAYDSVEVIVVDDGSTDDTAGVLSEYDSDPRVRVIYADHSGLPAVARNRGMEEANGASLAFLDADDYWYPEKLEKQVRCFRDPEIVGVAAGSTMVGDLQFRRQKTPRRADELLDFMNILRTNTVSLSSLVVRNEGWRFTERPDFRFVEDLDFLLNLTRVKNRRIMRLGAQLVFYRVHSESGSGNVADRDNVLNVLKAHEGEVPVEQMAEVYATQLQGLAVRVLRSDGCGRSDYLSRAWRYARGATRLRVGVLWIIALLPMPVIRGGLRIYYSVRH